jgi:hypothetical protein
MSAVGQQFVEEHLEKYIPESLVDELEGIDLADSMSDMTSISRESMFQPIALGDDEDAGDDPSSPSSPNLDESPTHAKVPLVLGSKIVPQDIDLLPSFPDESAT